MRLAALLLVLGCSTAHALDYSEYSAQLRSEPGRLVARAYLDGLGRAIGMYDTLQRMDKRPPRFCLPSGTRYSPELLAGMIDRQVELSPQFVKMPVEAIVFTALAVDFPCK